MQTYEVNQLVEYSNRRVKGIRCWITNVYEQNGKTYLDLKSLDADYNIVHVPAADNVKIIK